MGSAQVLMAVVRAHQDEELAAFDRCTNRALRVLGYRTSGPVSAWKQLGMHVFPETLSHHARLQAVQYFKGKGLGTRNSGSRHGF